MYRREVAESALRPVDIDDLRLLIEPEASRKRLQISWVNDLHGVSAVAVESVRQVTLNLLINACAATLAGGAVHFRARATESWLTIEVGDQGPGLPDDLASYLVGLSQDAPGAGRGLGLWIVRRLVADENGEIPSSFRKAACRRSSGLRGPCARICHDRSAHTGLLASRRSMPNEPGCVAVVDDDPIMGESLQRALQLEGWRAVWWQTGKKAVDGMSDLCPDLVLCDIRLPDMDGDEVFRATNARTLAPPFIFMTAFGQIDQAVALIRAGAQDYLTKPFELASLFQKVREAMSLRVGDAAQGALGVSPSMRGIEALLRRLASRSLPILFTGETGTGKEVCARFLHGLSPAATEPFMAVNCAAIPSDLLESEVFGHERGAFSGAHQRHLGYAERARGGVLFLDEIAAMPLALQAKLLRVLEERSFHRVGGEGPISLKARIVCATSERLDDQTRRGAFREDLLYRINAVTVEVPPLRERPEDISWLLCRYFSLFTEQAETELRGISSMAEEIALSHPWRGNVRELRNQVERAVTLSTGPWIMPTDIFPEMRTVMFDTIDPMVSLAAVRDAAEKRQIERVLRETAGHIGITAKRLEISRTTLWEKMRRFGIEPDRTIE